MPPKRPPKTPPSNIINPMKTPDQMALGYSNPASEDAKPKKQYLSSNVPEFFPAVSIFAKMDEKIKGKLSGDRRARYNKAVADLEAKHKSFMAFKQLKFVTKQDTENHMSAGKDYLKALADSFQQLAIDVDSEFHAGNLSGIPTTNVNDEKKRCDIGRLDALRNRAYLLGENEPALYQRLLATESLLADAISEKLSVPAGARLTKKSGKESAADDKAQGQFRTRILNAYSAKRQDGKQWCCISRKWFSTPGAVVAAHIASKSLGEPNMSAFFGDEGSAHRWATRNGIPLRAEWEGAFDAFQLSIVPWKEGDEADDTAVGDSSVPPPDKKRFRVVLFDKRLDSGDRVESRGYKLDGRLLGFQSEQRPGLRYLRFQFSIGFYSRRRYDVEGWEQDFAKHARAVFDPSPGKYLEQGGSFLFSLARLVGLCDDLGPMAPWVQQGHESDIVQAVMARAERRFSSSDSDKSSPRNVSAAALINPFNPLPEEEDIVQQDKNDDN